VVHRETTDSRTPVVHRETTDSYTSVPVWYRTPSVHFGTFTLNPPYTKPWPPN